MQPKRNYIYRRELIPLAIVEIVEKGLTKYLLMNFPIELPDELT